jgi:hypothetical protein
MMPIPSFKDTPDKAKMKNHVWIARFKPPKEVIQPRSISVLSYPDVFGSASANVGDLGDPVRLLGCDTVDS